MIASLTTAIAALWLCQGHSWPPHHKIDEVVAAEALAQCRATWADGTQWKNRAATIRDHLVTTLGFDPGHDRPPVTARVSTPRQQLGYTVSNVLLQTAPGLYIAGNLYVPDGAPPPEGRPVVLSPHGHFRGTPDDPPGRFQHDKQRLCAAFALRGAVVMAWDMVGWGESTWIGHADARTTILQTWNSTRVLDWLLQRDDVDESRIGVTGSSGGGTQTFLLTAVDDRVAVSVPVVMVSAHFFGGCLCESGLPIHHGPAHRTNNVEIAALAAPRPLLLISCGGDWTANTPTVGFPYVQDVYGACSAAGQCANVHLADEGHDYGRSKQAAAISFLAEHLSLLDPPPLLDDGEVSSVPILPRLDLAAVTEGNPLPENAITTHREAIEAIGSVVLRGMGR